MKKQKLSLNGIKNVLSRTEMKQIMAGSGIYYCCLCSWDGGIFSVILPDTVPGTNCGQFCSSQGYQTGAPIDMSHCNY